MTEIGLQQSERRLADGRAVERMVAELAGPLARLFARRRVRGLQGRAGRAATAPARGEPGGADELRTGFRDAAADVRGVGAGQLLPQLLLELALSCRRAVFVLLAELPRARVYHAISTGYAGLLMRVRSWRRADPALLTEHGIYTNERRVEIAMADWLADRVPGSPRTRRAAIATLRDVWMEAFCGYCARPATRRADKIITLYAGNQVLQQRDGAPRSGCRSSRTGSTMMSVDSRA